MAEHSDRLGHLGVQSAYENQYNPDLLFPIPRQEKRQELGIKSDSLPFHGLDIWTAYELSWLNLKGKPEVRIAEFAFQADSEYLIESKSFKLYLNSLNGTRFETEHAVLSRLQTDLSTCCGADVAVELRRLDWDESLVAKLPGINLDELDIQVEHYNVNPGLLQCETSEPVSETLNSHLLKSNCLVTSQPDWGSVVIRYEGAKIDHASLLRYIISYREHDEFHEQCVERIFSDIMKQCQPEKLTVYARYVRRGGLDINPYRSNYEDEFDISRTLRQ